MSFTERVLRFFSWVGTTLFVVGLFGFLAKLFAYSLNGRGDWSLLVFLILTIMGAVIAELIEIWFDKLNGYTRY